MDYPQTLDFLFSKLPMYQRVGAAALKFNLDNVTALMAALGNPQDKIKTIHVAGTNGKGSSSHMLASVLQAAGYKTGLFTSPHLRSFTERIKINGREISEAAVVEFVAEIEPVIARIQPSFFEITFAMAMHHFQHQQVDVAVIEVGLGGRLDSTNIINPEICLITNISFDHQQFLGNDLKSIAAEKAGIIKPGVPVIISEEQAEVAGVFIEKAAAAEAEITFATREIAVEQAAQERINIITDDKIFLEGLRPDLQGSYQQLNMLGVIAGVRKLNAMQKFVISKEALRLGLENTVAHTGFKGRWQIIRKKPLTIADTGHNKAGIQKILTELTRFKYNTLHIVWGMVNDKNVAEVLAMLPKAARYYFVQAAIPRALELEILLAEAGKAGLTGDGYKTVLAGVQAAQGNADVNDLVFIGGSTFVVAEIDEL